MVSLVKKIFNFAKASARHAAGGFRHVTESTFNTRTSICNECPLNRMGECGLCGCPIEKKALWASESCPDSKWLAIPEEGDPVEQKRASSGFSAQTSSSKTPVPQPKKRKCGACRNRH